MKTKNTKSFASRWGFILASVGSAVGMANVWGFPNKMGSNGGGAFLLIYLLFVVIFSTCLLYTSAYIGHETCLAGGDIVVLKHNEDPKYLSYALSTLDAQKQKSKGKVKSKVVHSSVPDIKAIRIPVPPLPVQREIVRIKRHCSLRWHRHRATHCLAPEEYKQSAR